MGCDIHCYMETREHDHWWSFGGRINPGRNYAVFSVLAEVRGMGPRIVPDRGMPTDAAWVSKDDNVLRVDDAGEAAKDPKACSVAQAEKWVASGNSRYVPLGDKRQYYVSHPDWHSHSWATPDEWAAALSAVPKSCGPQPEYWAMLAAMRELEKHGQQARVVFWFDN